MQVVLICPWEGVRRGIAAFTTRQGMKLVNLNGVQALQDWKGALPEIVVLDASFPPALLERFHAWASQTPPVRFIFITNKPQPSGLARKAFAIPRCRSVLGGERFVARVTEAVADAIGVRARVHFRRDVQLQGQVESGGKIADHFVENLSQSGAKIRTALVMEPRAIATVRFDLEGQAIVRRAEVVRAISTQGGWQYGLHFIGESEQPLPLKETVIRAAPEYEQLRGADRTWIPKRLSVKARVTPEGGTARHYLTVQNLSVDGLGGEGVEELQLEAGQRCEVTLLWPGKSLRLSAEVLRRENERDRTSFGVRFLEVDAASKHALGTLVEAAARVGLRTPKRPPPGKKRRV